MKLIDAYTQALNEESDPIEREEFSGDQELKQMVLDEIFEAMKEIRDAKVAGNASRLDMVKPLFSCVAIWFIVGIRVGKILRDEELGG